MMRALLPGPPLGVRFVIGIASGTRSVLRPTRLHAAPHPHPHSLRPHPHTHARARPQVCNSYLALHSPPARRTEYMGIAQVQPEIHRVDPESGSTRRLL
jgi:hypothetical protein